MFATPHARLEHEYAGPADAYAFVPPPAIPLNALAYQHVQDQYSQQHEPRRSAGQLQQQHQYYLDDLSPSSAAAPPNIARQHHQQQMYMSAAVVKEELPPTLPKRARGERISSRDFIPPDVSGLSKREARLVKNRAAAFLSRQRKREEFEGMEQRVADLEAQNARLLAMAGMPPAEAHAAHVAALQARIATLERERALLAATAATDSSRSPSPSSSQGSSLRQPSVDSAHSAAGMGLMALLSLSSMSPPTTKFAFAPGGADEPTPVTATPFNYDSIARWQARLAASSPAPAAEGTGAEFDIAFSQTDDGRIRCHVSVPPVHASPEYMTEPLPASAGAYTTTFADAGAWQHQPEGAWQHPQQEWSQQPQEWAQPAPQPAPVQQLGPARRVRVALRAADVRGGSGEWEVEVC